MHFLHLTLLTSLTLLSSTLAQVTPTSPLYYLKSRILPPSPQNPAPPAHINDLYVYASHTGAGFNDALFTTNASIATRGFLNQTAAGANQIFILGLYPYGISLIYQPYTGWGPVEIDAGPGDAGYVFRESGDGAKVLVVQNGTGEAGEWGGWRACDWNHDAVQLFWKYNFYGPTEYPAPSNCADIELVQVLI